MKDNCILCKKKTEKMVMLNAGLHCMNCYEAGLLIQDTKDRTETLKYQIKCMDWRNKIIY